MHALKAKLSDAAARMTRVSFTREYIQREENFAYPSRRIRKFRRFKSTNRYRFLFIPAKARRRKTDNARHLRNDIIIRDEYRWRIREENARFAQSQSRVFLFFFVLIVDSQCRNRGVSAMSLRLREQGSALGGEANPRVIPRIARSWYLHTTRNAVAAFLIAILVIETPKVRVRARVADNACVYDKAMHAASSPRGSSTRARTHARIRIREISFV